MVKTINIDGKPVKFSTSFAWMLHYKAQFGVDPATFIIPATTAAAKDKTGLEALNSIGFVNIAQIAWACAKVADKDIADPESWYAGFDEFPIVEIATELLPVVFSSFNVKKK